METSVRTDSAVEIDPIAFAVIKSGLDAIVDEMAYTVVRTARSEIVKDVMDFSAALCAADGQMVAQAKTIALHLGAVPEAMASVLARFDGNLWPGDVVILNDPYLGGMHLPDIFMFMPIFHGDRLRAFAVVIAHHTDVGGRVPGSNASDSTEIFQEGLRIPPAKLFERGERNWTLFDVIAQNVRVPDRVIGDLGAQVAACKVGERELGKLIDQYGADMVATYMTQLLDYTELMTRDEIRSWPEGTYTFTDYIDDDGIADQPLPITVAVTVAGGHLSVDYAGSAPQVRAAINATLSYTKSCTYLSMRCLLQRDVPNNAGIFRCISVTAPERSILNLATPAACAARALTGYRIVDAVFGAMAQALPERVPAAGEGGNTVVCIGGHHPDGTPFIVVDMICGAWGGRPDKDGLEAVTNPSQNLSNTPVEVLEAQHPVRIDEYALIADSCGAGRFRGGLGIAREYVLLADEALLQLRSDRVKFAPYGLAGGQPGRPSRNVINPGRDARAMPSKFAITLRAGDTIRHEQAAGGGHGNPFVREPERVAADVRDQKISPDYALREHGVVIDPETFAVDHAATLRRRESLGTSERGS
jgi:N-methylhydantoinase B